MRNQNERAMFSLLFKREIKDNTGNLQYYLDKIKEHSGIEIKDGKDLEKVQKEVQRLLDKYAERYPDKESEAKQEKADFEDHAMGIFVFMEMPYNGEMTLRTFSNLKKQADRRMKVLEKNKK